MADNRADREIPSGYLAAQLEGCDRATERAEIEHAGHIRPHRRRDLHRMPASGDCLSSCCMHLIPNNICLMLGIQRNLYGIIGISIMALVSHAVVAVMASGPGILHQAVVVLLCPETLHIGHLCLHFILVFQRTLAFGARLGTCCM